MTNEFKLLPPHPDLCQECAVDHEPNEPHNRDSMFYQVKFHKENGRWPSWMDAVSHCDKETQDAWIKELKKRGIDIL